MLKQQALGFIATTKVVRILPVTRPFGLAQDKLRRNVRFVSAFRLRSMTSAPWRLLYQKSPTSLRSRGSKHQSIFNDTTLIERLQIVANTVATLGLAQLL